MLRTRLEALADQVHILRVLLDLRVRGLLKDVILTIVNLVQQVLIIDAKHLVLQQGSVRSFVLLLKLHSVFLGLLALGTLVVRLLLLLTLLLR